ncbi:MAG TPA: tRNA epoxyqueuosine(34) reductase QueG [Burkholderiaceae bacterium]|nr:tRNA epoxyqueuosine(34) reductase QueG [Burkholderiaceae bacterium]HNG80859.1 tRNA epoxyqueuosine(34) reductase QueG [Burkholderiaceae bacterium]
MTTWAEALGFSQIGVADVNLGDAEPGLLRWLEAGWHGTMGYMASHGLKRARPAELLPGTLRVITVRMDYLPRDGSASPATQGVGAAADGRTPDWRAQERARAADPKAAVVSVYARGRDYHKVLRQRLQRLADQLQAAVGPRGHRVFCDSAPVLEVELASRSALGWRGKHTLLLDRQGGSMSFLGELFIDLPLPLTAAAPAEGHCGRCRACLDACPTGAIVAPYRLDARRCISYLTIEHDGPIPVEFRAAMGNRIYGCDDCQLVCPWNKFARRSALPDFDERAPLSQGRLIDLWRWDEATFLRATEGGPIRRIGHARWLRNLAVALGNAWRSTGEAAVAAALRERLTGADALLAEHIAWALAQREDDSASHGDQCSAANTVSASGTLSMPSSVEAVTRPAT